jgi:hypothetical protein
MDLPEIRPFSSEQINKSDLVSVVSFYSIDGELAAAGRRDQANSFLVTMVRVPPAAAPGVSFSSTGSLGLSPGVPGPGARYDGRRFEQAIQASVTAPGFFQPKSRNRAALVSNLLRSAS